MKRMTKRSEYGMVKYNHDSDGHGIVWDSMILDRLAAYEDTGLEPEEIVSLVKGELKDATVDIGTTAYDLVVSNVFEKRYGITLDRMCELAEADKDGRCAILPCNVGVAVWTNFSIQGSYLRKTDRPYECRVLFVGLNESDSGGYINFEYVKSGYQFQMDFDQIGKTVFLTREAAEAALKAGDHS